MKQPGTLILIGLRGSGKTTLGSLLANRLEVAFADVDDLVLERFDCDSVTQVWKEFGEGAWRDMEIAVCRELLRDHNNNGSDEKIDSGIPRVIAFGGGAAMLLDVQRVVRRAQDAGRILVVYLRGQPETLHRRLQCLPPDDPNDRPALTDESSPLGEMKLIFHKRDPGYCDLADVVVDVDAHGTVNETLEVLLREFERRQQSEESGRVIES